MTVFLINLAKEKDRLRRATAQLARLSVPYERVEGVYVKELDEKTREASLDRFRWWCAEGIPCGMNIFGCTLSHNKIYAQMVERELDFACVLEDDVYLADGFKDALAHVESWLDVRRPQVVLLSNHSSERFEGGGGRDSPLSGRHIQRGLCHYKEGVRAFAGGQSSDYSPHRCLGALEEDGRH